MSGRNSDEAMSWFHRRECFKFDNLHILACCYCLISFFRVSNATQAEKYTESKKITDKITRFNHNIEIRQY